MKLLGLILLIVGLGNPSQEQENIISQVKDAIKTGSSKEISKLLASNLEMNMDGKMKNYSKSQAEFILKDFFKKNQPESFTIVHQGSSKSGLPYAIGSYKSKTETYRVWVRIRKVKTRYVIHEMSFIKE